jgi:phenylalanyl-tRNA synthetase beta chain
MGGLESEVSDGTTRVLLESANFEPKAIRRTSRRLGLISESSYRFERGVDAEGVDIASARAAELMARLGGGRIARGLVDEFPTRPAPRKVTVRASRATALTGVDISRDVAAEMLGRLGLEVSPTGDDTLEVTCTSARPDLEREVDLIEEIIRLYGFDKVPATLPRSGKAPSGGKDRRPELARNALVAAGLSEAITFGFTSPTRIEAMRFSEDDRRGQPLVLRNPMSVEQSVMRTSLLPNLLGSVARNIGFQVSDVFLFEVGSVHLPRPKREHELADEHNNVAAVISGDRLGWLKPGDPVDFYDAKGILERLLVALLGPEGAAAVSFSATSEIPYMHPGLCATVTLADGTRVGEIGEIHPETRAGFGIDAPVFGFEVDLGAFPAPSAAQMAEISKYPAIARDLSFFVDEQVPAARVDGLIAEADEPLIEQVVVLEDYRDPGKVPEGKKGMLWSITYRSPERTLTDAEVDAAHEAIVARLMDTLPAERR